MLNVTFFDRYRKDIVGLGGLGVSCSPRDLRFLGSNPSEVDGFFHKSFGSEFKPGVPSLRFQDR